jgi:hypothetical protein
MNRRSDEGMETSELLRRAWEAVQESGVPESIHEAAFAQAVADLRASETPASIPANSHGRDGKTKPRSRRSESTADAGSTEVVAVDEATFFARLAEESGVEERDLRDVLALSGDKVLVTPPTRELGFSTAAQAKTVIPLVAGARAFGLAERPVDAGAVRAELARKNCYQERKFAERHLGPLRGFNAGASSSQIVTTSKWVAEFTAAINRVLGRPEIEAES